MFGTKKKNEVNTTTNIHSFVKSPPKKENIPIEIIQDKISIFNEIDQIISQ